MSALTLLKPPPPQIVTSDIECHDICNFFSQWHKLYCQQVFSMIIKMAPWGSCCSSFIFAWLCSPGVPWSAAHNVYPLVSWHQLVCGEAGAQWLRPGWRAGQGNQQEVGDSLNTIMNIMHCLCGVTHSNQRYRAPSFEPFKLAFKTCPLESRDFWEV